MARPFRTVGLIGKHGDPRVATTLEQLTALLNELAVDVVFDAESAEQLPSFGLPVVERDVLGSQSDLVIVVAGDGDDEQVRAMLRAVRRTFLPQRVVALADGEADTTLLPVLEGRASGDRPLTYICQNYACQAPIESAGALAAELSSLGGLRAD